MADTSDLIDALRVRLAAVAPLPCPPLLELAAIAWGRASTIEPRVFALHVGRCRRCALAYDVLQSDPHLHDAEILAAAEDGETPAASDEATVLGWRVRGHLGRCDRCDGRRHDLAGAITIGTHAGIHAQRMVASLRRELGTTALTHRSAEQRRGDTIEAAVLRHDDTLELHAGRARRAPLTVLEARVTSEGRLVVRLGVPREFQRVLLAVRAGRQVTVLPEAHAEAGLATIVFDTAEQGSALTIPADAFTSWVRAAAPVPLRPSAARGDDGRHELDRGGDPSTSSRDDDHVHAGELLAIGGPDEESLTRLVRRAEAHVARCAPCAARHISLERMVIAPPAGSNHWRRMVEQLRRTAGHDDAAAGALDAVVIGALGALVADGDRALRRTVRIVEAHVTAAGDLLVRVAVLDGFSRTRLVVSAGDAAVAFPEVEIEAGLASFMVKTGEAGSAAEIPRSALAVWLRQQPPVGRG